MKFQSSSTISEEDNSNAKNDLTNYSKRNFINIKIPSSLYHKLIAYALLFVFISQIIIFSPGISFSNIYHVRIPSCTIIPCCNMLSIIPTFTAYLSDNLIIFIIPINLILTVVLSTLVSVNMILTSYVFQNKQNNNGNSRSKNAKNS